MTLGPKFFFCNKMAVARRRKHLNPCFLAESAAFDLYFLIPVSDHDLNPSGTFFRKFACDLGFAAYQIFCPKGPCGTTFWQKIWLSSKINLLGIWKIQNVEQVQLVSDPILPASETFNQTFKNMNYCKKLKICMRPWIRSLSNISPKRPLREYLMTHFIKYSKKEALAGICNDPFY